MVYMGQKLQFLGRTLLSLYIIFILLEICTEVGGSEDYYEILGVKKNADNREIRRAFKKLAMTNHPDKNMDDPEAHDKFVKINKAYEILKDDETRKKYDLYGEEGLKDMNSNSWKGNFRSWTYYSESFGIYDDDLEIITLNKNEFEKSVLNAPDVWFVNYYSPQCSHCHQLAPAWRSLARDLEGVIRIGAVNCEEDWSLCRKENIWSYPSLILYPQKIKYQGSREASHMVEYVLKQLPNKVLKLSSNFETTLQDQKYNMPWLISFCMTDKGCFFKEDLKKLSIMMEGLVSVAEVDCLEEKLLCQKLGKTSGMAFFPKLSSKDYTYHTLSGVDHKDIAHAILQLLPDIPEITNEEYSEIKDELRKGNGNPWLLYFKKADNENDESIMRELKRLTGMLLEVKIGQIDCSGNTQLCTELYVQKFPMFIALKRHGSYEIHHGRTTAHDIAVFVREAISSHIETLTPEIFPNKVILKDETWLVDFFAPWCPPCMHLLPEVRKASRMLGHKVRFGTVDCTVHSNLCSKYNIRNYPTTILYNDTSPHIYYGMHMHKDLVEFIQDILNPPVIDLTPSSFSNLVENKNYKDTWVIDYFAPWCRPCQQLGVQWRKLAKMLSNDTGVHVASVNCQIYQTLCRSQGVHSYPDIRLYPSGSEGTDAVNIYNDWNRDAISLRAWVYSFLPSTVASLSSAEFFETVLSDNTPWVIDFYAPWCGHCQTFAPEFEVVSKKLSGHVKSGKINCDSLPHVCQQADVHAYPTVRYYSGTTGGKTQSPVGQEINSQQSDVIISFITQRLRKDLQHTRDEL